MNEFYSQLAKIVNTGQSRSVILSGNIHDLFPLDTLGDVSTYMPLVEYLSKKSKVATNETIRGLTIVTYEINQKIRFFGNEDQFKEAWKATRVDDDFDKLIQESYLNSVVAMEFLKQLCICSRNFKKRDDNLLIIIEGADLLLPEASIANMQFTDRKRCAIVRSWLSDPGFCNGEDTVVLITESPSAINSAVSKLPQILDVEIPYPDLETRRHFIDRMKGRYKSDFNEGQLAKQTAGLSIHAVRQLLCSEKIDRESINAKVEQYICSQLGEGVVEFYKPKCRFKEIVGNTNVKKFMLDEVIPRFQTDNKDSALSGMMICGSIGSGKSYLGDGLAAELDLPVLLLKNIRSKWYGETDVIFERLYRLLVSFSKIVIFVDECDTVFQNLSISEDIPTEKRLTGKIQAMMSDPNLKGRVLWILLTARINLVSRDILRPGRMDLIIPVLDPCGDDRKEFIKWVLDAIGISESEQVIGFETIDKATEGYSAASFSSLRSLLKSKGCKTIEQVVEISNDLVESDIVEVRKYQNLQALLNCTRKSLLPVSDIPFNDRRKAWRKEIMELEANGIR